MLYISPGLEFFFDTYTVFVTVIFNSGFVAGKIVIRVKIFKSRFYEILIFLCGTHPTANISMLGCTKCIQIPHSAEHANCDE